MNQYGSYTQDTFINRSTEIHKGFYDYSSVHYVNSNEMVDIICPIHGLFKQRPADHVRGIGCPVCGQIRTLKRRKEEAKASFIKKCHEKHGDKYSYEKTVYEGSKKEVIITCKKHGDFLIRPNNILMGQGCKACYDEIRHEMSAKDTNWFINKANQKHHYKYDYSKTCYYNSYTKVIITCRKHGDFEQAPGSHLYGIGCPKCYYSHGEEDIYCFLKEHNIEFISQYKIKNDFLFCKNKEFKVDFYIPSRCLFIEYNGEQHYKPIKLFGGYNTFEKQHERDCALRQYCKEHKIKLIEISYNNKKEIPLILCKALKINC